MIDWRADTFLDVCETLNYTRTAERLSITQPAVSQHIAWLEQELKAKLVRRRGRTLALTEAGALARDMLRAHRNDENALRRFVAREDHEAGTLRIGATLTAGEYLLARPLARWCAAHPRMRVSVAAADTEQLLAQLDAGTIDCALVEGIFDESRYASLTWSVERMVCVEAAGGDEPTGCPATLHDLIDRTLIVREPGSGSRAVLESALARENLAPESFARVVEAAGVNMACEMAAAGLGITFVYEPAARRLVDAEELREIPLADCDMRHPIAFVWQKNALFAERYRTLFRDLRAYAERL